MHRIYLDHTATTPLDPRVFDAMKPYFLENFGNASSIHSFGREARAALDLSRDVIAKALGAKAGEIFFTSGGTESDNFALKGAAWKMREHGKSNIVTSAIEHHAVLDSCDFLERQGFTVTHVAPDEAGKIHPEAVRAAMRSDTGLVSIMHANNEVGTINPIAEIAAIAHEHGAMMHSDAVQTFGKIPIAVDELGADLLTISAHKIYGPKGIGVLYIRKGAEVEQFMHGGGQERGRRAGTENVPLAVGMAEATGFILTDRESESARLGALRNRFRDMLVSRFPAIRVNGHTSECLPHILNVSFDHEKVRIDGESLLFNLDLAGIAVTSGSACTSGSMDPSHVLLAMGVPAATAKATIRFSMGKSTTEEMLSETTAILADVVGRIGQKV